MSCHHCKTCPLLPILGGSVHAWRASYCDTSSGWRECARYQLAARGGIVPISMLPNGRTPVALQRAVERATRLPDHATRLPDHATRLPDHATRLPDQMPGTPGRAQVFVPSVVPDRGGVATVDRPSPGDRMLAAPHRHALRPAPGRALTYLSMTVAWLRREY